MSKQHTVAGSDCIHSIAFDNGFLPETIWNDPHNGELQKQRKLNVLLEGDVVHVPDPRPKVQSAATDKRHRFVRKGVPATVGFKVQRLGKPIANANYTLVIDGTRSTGTTGGDGSVHARIPPNARSGSLTVDDHGDTLTYALDLGRLDPGTELTGLQQRLANLGYAIAPDDYGTLGSGTRRAIALFQVDHDLPGTGEADANTMARVVDAYGF